MKKWIEDLQYDLEEEIKEFVGSNTLIGDPILFFDQIIVIPVFEMVVLLGEGHAKAQFECLGTGLELIPKAFLVIIDGEIEVILLKNEDSNVFVTEKVLDVTI
ncbi:hypothetical protein [Bacillus sp. OAE603]|uniref:hypothetical protein n=1 Tax=Gottfriedia sp. OAE603 TaxID=2663872 RepID=UPI0017890881